MKIEWLDEPEHHDYPAALSYLCLHFPLEHAGQIVHDLRAAGMTEFKAKDIIRASGLTPLGVSNSHVEHNRQKLHDGKKLSPVLLVRVGEKVLIADGYHRVCTVFGIDEDAVVPAKIV
jgi:hypothetical protein